MASRRDGTSARTLPSMLSARGSCHKEHAAEQKTSGDNNEHDEEQRSDFRKRAMAERIERQDPYAKADTEESAPERQVGTVIVSTPRWWRSCLIRHDNARRVILGADVTDRKPRTTRRPRRLTTAILRFCQQNAKNPGRREADPGAGLCVAVSSGSLMPGERTALNRSCNALRCR